MHGENLQGDTRIRAFGLRVAKWSPRLAFCLVAGTVALWAAIPAHVEWWLAEFVLGVAVSPLVIKFYKSGDMMYAMLYGAAIGGIGVALQRMTLGSFGGPAVLAGAVPLLAGVATVIAIMKDHLVQELQRQRSLVAKPYLPRPGRDHL